ncbi:beta-sarcoglycan [Onthophagus taurus]|uniref:beta-sarcoglycan n=1 Tax=Onthophagus taurus TaxID=166361 RepID=UPI000C200B99|nr:beta-sarcoglycan [Onthophagus taurus]
MTERHFETSSPISDHYSEEMDSLGMREKSLLKRSVSKHHNNNFKAGYVPVHEQYLHKTGIRGRKTFAFWTLIALIFILAVGNLVLTSIILGVLRLGQGMESLELVPLESSIKFYGDTDLGYVNKRDGKIEGFSDVPIEIIGDNGSILVTLNLNPNSRASKKLEMKENLTGFYSINNFEVKNREGKVVFSTDFPQINIVKPIKNLKTEYVQTNRVSSSVDKKLEVEGRSVSLKGSEGTHMEGKEFIWKADQDIYLKSINGNIVLDAAEGIRLDMKKIPIAMKREGVTTNQYKVCVCNSTGKLFRIPDDQKSKIFCDHFESKHNPCL